MAEVEVPTAAPTALAQRHGVGDETRNGGTATFELSARPSPAIDVQTQVVTEDADLPPDGGYGWVIIFVCFVHTFWVNLWAGSWGIMQAALLRTTLQGSSLGTLSFVGSLGVALGPALGIPVIRIVRVIGARAGMLTGIVIYGGGCLLSSVAVHSVVGLFLACGLTYGIGSAFTDTLYNTLPVLWFKRRLGTANGIVKLGGSIGAMVGALAVSYLADGVGVAWTFRILGIVSLATGVPTALLIKDRGAPPAYPIRWSVFRDAQFSWHFAAGAVGIFPIYAPTFFLPYINNALGLSNSTSTATVVCLLGCMSIGRLVTGLACDRVGSMNVLFVTSLVNAASLFAVWPFSSNLGLVLLFCILNGLSNGGFAVAMPTAVGRHLPVDEAPGALSFLFTGWAPGILAGNAISSAMIQLTNADSATSISPFRPAMFYFGGTALLSTACGVMARLICSRHLWVAV
ncbi:monocarboxylate transporter [Fusarium albosuccineum]|uniref:Monocarboxylate transporter n=1 Tax=Fusarium albosuccineum TaxID=1237068 RepID=A0A8H4LKZ7_9HYPO|nr:monocarboxylate transporter [Fusarium albosuccineum]